MRSLYVLPVLIAALVASLAVTAAAFGDVEAKRKEFTRLSGDEEVPPADPNGAGLAKLRLATGVREGDAQPQLTGQVCWKISVANIGTATAAHIHRAPMGQNGPVVVDMSPVPPEAEDGEWRGCRKPVNRNLVRDIIRNPTSYYVNVHNQEFPGGAIRGQLGD